jgi:cell division protein FtsQ
MTRENHSDVHRPDGRRSEARYGPGGSASVRRREQLAAKGARRRDTSRVAPTKTKAKAPAQPLFTPRRQRILVSGLAVAALGSLAGIFLFSPLTYVREVRLGGVRSLQRDEADSTAAAVRVPSKTNLFRLRTAALEERLEALPWVASATVSRRFPGGLNVSITPRTPRAQLRVNGQDWEVDRAGVVIRPLRAGVALPPIVCAAPAEVRPGSIADALGVAGALKVLSECAPRGGVRIAKVDVDATGELCLNMTDNVAIRLGQEEALPTKIDYVQRIYDDNPAIGSEVQSIDLRWPESTSLVPRSTRKSGQEGTAESSPQPVDKRSLATGRD